MKILVLMFFVSLSSCVSKYKIPDIKRDLACEKIRFNILGIKIVERDINKYWSNKIDDPEVEDKSSQDKQFVLKSEKEELDFINAHLTKTGCVGSVILVKTDEDEKKADNTIYFRRAVPSVSTIDNWVNFVSGLISVGSGFLLPGIYFVNGQAEVSDINSQIHKRYLIETTSYTHAFYIFSYQENIRTLDYQIKVDMIKDILREVQL